MTPFFKYAHYILYYILYYNFYYIFYYNFFPCESGPRACTVERLSGELAHEDDDGDDEPDGDPAEGEEHVRVAQRDRLAVTPADVVRLAWQKESFNAEVVTSSS